MRPRLPFCTWQIICDNYQTFPVCRNSCPEYQYKTRLWKMVQYDERKNKAAISISTNDLITKGPQERKGEDGTDVRMGTWVKIQLKMFRRDSRKPHFTIKLPPTRSRCAYFRFYCSSSAWAIWGDWIPKFLKRKVSRVWLAEVQIHSLGSISSRRECKAILDILELDSYKVRGNGGFSFTLIFSFKRLIWFYIYKPSFCGLNSRLFLQRCRF